MSHEPAGEAPDLLLPPPSGRSTDGAPRWSARALATALGYPSYRAFQPALARARRAAGAAGLAGPSHFQPIPARGRQADWQLSRAACFLVAQNANATYPAVARAQSYLAVQTRRSELREPAASSAAAAFFATQLEERLRREGSTDPQTAAQVAAQMRTSFATAFPEASRLLSGGDAEGPVPATGSTE